MAIIELKNVSGLLEATMSDYLDSAVVKEKTTRKELVKLLQATDESLGTALNIMEGKNARYKTLEHDLEDQKLENSKISQRLEDTTEGLTEVEALVESLEHDLGEAVLEKNNAEEREAKAKFELSSCKTQLEGALTELRVPKNSFNEVLERLDKVRGENIELRASLEEYKSRGFFARIFNK